MAQLQQREEERSATGASPRHVCHAGWHHAGVGRYEIAVNFPSWDGGLQASLVSAIVLSQLAGPPLLKYTLTLSGEAANPGGVHADDAGRSSRGGGNTEVGGRTRMTESDVAPPSDVATCPFLCTGRPRAAPVRRAACALAEGAITVRSEAHPQRARTHSRSRP